MSDAAPPSEWTEADWAYFYAARGAPTLAEWTALTPEARGRALRAARRGDPFPGERPPEAATPPAQGRPSSREGLRAALREEGAAALAEADGGTFELAIPGRAAP